MTVNQLWLVSKNAYLKRFKSFSFWALVLGPLLIPVIAIIIGSFIGNQAQVKLAVVNQPQTAQYLSKDPTLDTKISQESSENTAQTALKNKTVDAYLNYDESKQAFVLNVRSDSASKININLLTASLSRATTEEKAASANLSTQELANLLSPAKVTTVKLDNAGRVVNNKNAAGNVFIASGVVILIFVFLTMYIGVISQEIANEKSNRIMEILLSVTSAKTQFYGKVIGVMLLAATHIAFYAAGGGLIFLFFRDNASLKALLSFIPGVDLSFLLFIGLMSFVAVIGYLLLAAIVASLVNDQSQAQQAAQPIMYLAMLGYIPSFFVVVNPSSPIFTVMSFIPFISPTMMPARYANQSANASQIWIAFTLQLAATLLVGYYGQRVYAKNVLSYSEQNLIAQLFKNLRRKD